MCLSARHVSFGQAGVSSMCFSPNHVSFGRAHVFFAPQVLVFVGCTRSRASAARRAASVRSAVRSARGVRSAGAGRGVSIRCCPSAVSSMCLSARHVSFGQACVFRPSMCLKHVFFAEPCASGMCLWVATMCFSPISPCIHWIYSISRSSAGPPFREPARTGVRVSVRPGRRRGASIRGAASGKCSIPSVRSGGKCSIRRKCSIRGSGATGKSVRSQVFDPECSIR